MVGKDRDFDCKEPYIREEDLITQIVSVLEKVQIDKAQFNKILQEEYDRFSKFKAILNEESTDEEKKKLKEIDVKTFAKHVLRYGTNPEKREIFTLKTATLFKEYATIY